ncbi:SMI1/KNR4 family protein [Chryseobacterium sp.]|uniref:SMI1/KNR4 family protein n=1 Tax=Chryseobacterium sp. TaxID=1871047 RepID=UPI0026110ABD|nr:SMI1/KNR4 family protein [Chryseobacterium sp.]
MSLQYFKELNEYLIKNKWNNSNVSLASINQLEIKINKEFPKAYKEFLELTGKHFYPIHNSNTGLGGTFDFLESANENAKEQLKDYGLQNIIKRDFWTVAESDGSIYIHYIFFDEGDNPPVYGLDMEGYTDDSMDSKEFHRKIANSFTEYIQNSINTYNHKLDK